MTYLRQQQPAKKRPPNMVHIGGAFYLVRTQAGLKKAIKDYFDEEDAKMEVYGYPKQYPAIIGLNTGYQGYRYIAIVQAHVNDLKKVLKEQGEI